MTEGSHKPFAFCLLPFAFCLLPFDFDFDYPRQLSDAPFFFTVASSRGVERTTA